MRVLIGCERFGVIRDAFIAAGHDAWSCDLVDSVSPGPHFKRDVRDVMVQGGWDLFIVHPDCTFLTAANTYIKRGCSKYTPEQAKAYQDEAVAFFMEVANAPVGKICIENPVGIMSTRWRKPDQIIQPWYFGHNESKQTCLWLKGLPMLVVTNVLPGDRTTRRDNQTPNGQNKLGPSADRAMLRAKTYHGVARAMAEQGGKK